MAQHLRPTRSNWWRSGWLLLDQRKGPDMQRKKWRSWTKPTANQYAATKEHLVALVEQAFQGAGDSKIQEIKDDFRRYFGEHRGRMGSRHFVRFVERLQQAAPAAPESAPVPGAEDLPPAIIPPPFDYPLEQRIALNRQLEKIETTLGDENAAVEVRREELENAAFKLYAAACASPAGQRWTQDTMVHMLSQKFSSGDHPGVSEWVRKSVEDQLLAELILAMLKAAREVDGFNESCSELSSHPRVQHGLCSLWTEADAQELLYRLRELKTEAADELRQKSHQFGQIDIQRQIAEKFQGLVRSVLTQIDPACQKLYLTGARDLDLVMGQLKLIDPHAARKVEFALGDEKNKVRVFLGKLLEATPVDDRKATAKILGDVQIWLAQQRYPARPES
jgi:hypothetical protein